MNLSVCFSLANKFIKKDFEAKKITLDFSLYTNS